VEVMYTSNSGARGACKYLFYAVGTTIRTRNMLTGEFLPDLSVTSTTVTGPSPLAVEGPALFFEHVVNGFDATIRFRYILDTGFPTVGVQGIIRNRSGGPRTFNIDTRVKKVQYSPIP